MLNDNSLQILSSSSSSSSKQPKNDLTITETTIIDTIITERTITRTKSKQEEEKEEKAIIPGQLKNQLLSDQPADIKICSSPDALFKIDSLVINPNPPHKGQKLSIKVEGPLRERVENGYVQVHVKLGVITLYNNRLNLCDILHNELQKDCPLEPGYLVLEKEVDIPNEIPPVESRFFLFSYLL